MKAGARPTVPGWILAGLILALVLGSLVALPQYGIGWDEGLGDLFFGHRNLAALTGAAGALDFERHHPVDGDGQTHPDLFLSPLRTRPWEHWPVMATLSAASCQLLARRLRLLDPVDAHHLAGVLVLALLVPVVYAAGRRSWGSVGAIVACLALLTHPRLLAAAWIDLKDIGSACFITVALLLLHRGLTTAKTWPFLAAGVAIGLALGTKANVLFLPAPIVAFWWIARPGLVSLDGRRRLALAAALPVALLVVYGSWAWLRPAPIERFVGNLAYVLSRGAAGDLQLQPWPALTVLASLPLGTLGLIGGGAVLAVRSWRRRDGALEGLALFAAGFPLARLCAPGATSFDGYRHALELVPPLALLAGAAGARLVAAPGRWRRLLLIGLLIEPAGEILAVHPYEMAHFSPLVGGPAGARRLGFPQVEDYWANTYRSGLEWIGRHAEPGAAVAAGIAEHVLFLEAPVRLPGHPLVRASSPFRPDPGLEVRRQFEAAARQRPVYFMYVTRTGWYNPIVLQAEQLPTVHSAGPVGAPMLKIVRFGPTEAPPGPGLPRPALSYTPSKNP